MIRLLGDDYPQAVPRYGRLFKTNHPGSERDHHEDHNPAAERVITAQLEPALREARAEERLRFERHGYFVADRIDSSPAVPVFNRTVANPGVGPRHESPSQTTTRD